MNKRVLLTIAFGLAASAPAFGTEINIISAGAVEPGVVAAAEVFRKETGTEVKIKFATAPAIQRRVGGGEAADVVIAPKHVLLDAESVVYNKASTGLYLEKLFDRLGVGAQIKGKETRYPDGAAVMEHVIHGKGKEIGFGAITEIRLYGDKGAQFVGPLPGDAQNYTSYAAASSAAPANRDGAAAFVKFLASPAARAAFLAKGVE